MKRRGRPRLGFTRRIPLMVSPELFDDLRRIARERKTTTSDLARTVLSAFVRISKG